MVGGRRSRILPREPPSWSPQHRLRHSPFPSQYYSRTASLNRSRNGLGDGIGANAPRHRQDLLVDGVPPRRGRRCGAGSGPGASWGSATYELLFSTLVVTRHASARASLATHTLKYCRAHPRHPFQAPLHSRSLVSTTHTLAPSPHVLITHARTQLRPNTHTILLVGAAATLVEEVAAGRSRTYRSCVAAVIARISY